MPGCVALCADTVGLANGALPGIWSQQAAGQQLPFPDVLSKYLSVCDIPNLASCGITLEAFENSEQ